MLSTALSIEPLKSTMQIYISRAGQQYGPFSMDQVHQALTSGSLVATDLAWHEGAANWVPLGQIVTNPSPAVANIPAAPTTPVKKGGKPQPQSSIISGVKKIPMWARIGSGMIILIALIWWLYSWNKSTGLPDEEPVKPPTSEQVQKSKDIIMDTIRQQLKKPRGNLTARDLGKVTNLQLFDSGIYDVSALGDLKRSKELDLSGNHINNLAPLTGLTNLEVLALHRNQVTDLTALANLKNLKNLGLEDNRITDLTPLAQLKQLKSLQLKDNPRLTKAQVQTLQQALPGCKIDSNAEQ